MTPVVTINGRRGFEDYLDGNASLRAIGFGLIFDSAHYIQVLDSRTNTYYVLTEFYNNFPAALEALEALDGIYKIQEYIDLINNAKSMTSQEFSEYLKLNSETTK